MPATSTGIACVQRERVVAFVFQPSLPLSGVIPRWTPVDEREAFSISMGRQPMDLLQINHASRLVPPAGLRSQRRVSSLDVGLSFGTANGRLMSEMPNTLRIREAYHYEPAPSSATASPTSSIISPGDFGKGAEAAESHRNNGLGKGEFVRPSWQKINADYRTNWNVTRDRYNLNRNVVAQEPQVSKSCMLTEPHVSASLQSAGSLSRDASMSSPAALAAGQMLADMQLEASAPKKPARDKRPSWSNIIEDYKHDWSISRDRYDLQRFTAGVRTWEGGRQFKEQQPPADAMNATWLQQSPGVNHGTMIVSHNNLVSYPKPYGISQLGSGLYAVSHPNKTSF